MSMPYRRVRIAVRGKVHGAARRIVRDDGQWVLTYCGMVRVEAATYAVDDEATITCKGCNKA